MGSNYVLSWHESVKNTAGSKAKDDVTEFLKEDGFNVIDTPYGKIQKILYVLKCPIIVRQSSLMIVGYFLWSSTVRN